MEPKLHSVSVLFRVMSVALFFLCALLGNEERALGASVLVDSRAEQPISHKKISANSGSVENASPSARSRETVSSSATTNSSSPTATWGDPSPARRVPSGMCSPHAQSVAAPSPVFPSNDTSIIACNQSGNQQWSTPIPTSPSERLASSRTELQQYGVLSSFPQLCLPRGILLTIEKTPRTIEKEHRRATLRPPRSN